MKDINAIRGYLPGPDGGLIPIVVPVWDSDSYIFAKDYQGNWCMMRNLCHSSVKESAWPLGPF